MSRLVLGTLNWGLRTSEDDAHGVMDRAHEHGLNFFDTSNVYGTVDYRGEAKSEIIIGTWFAKGGGRRERTVLATKLYQPKSDWPNDGRLSALHIRRACDDSLRRLQTDHIDLYQMHHVDRATPWDEIWEAMSVLRTQGKILYVGSSNFAGWHLASAQEAALQRHLLGLVSEQSIYNLATRDLEREVIPAAQHYGIGVLAWSPLHRGMLGGMLRREREQGPISTTRFGADALDARRPQLQRYEDLCAEVGVEPSHAAISWLLARPGITGAVTGPSSVEQLDDVVRSLDVRLDDSVLARLDEVFPGYRTAPEEYAF